jgi:hypothetical protein
MNTLQAHILDHPFMAYLNSLSSTACKRTMLSVPRVAPACAQDIEVSAVDPEAVSVFALPGQHEWWLGGLVRN